MILNLPLEETMDNPRIYIAEHDKLLQRDLKVILKKNGFDVSAFDSGYAIVSMMDNWPDIFLIDIELPGINGLEVCKWLKSQESTRHIPVIFISGQSYLKILAASAHADDYIQKPLVYPLVISKIRERLFAENEA